MEILEFLMTIVFRHHWKWQNFSIDVYTMRSHWKRKPKMVSEMVIRLLMNYVMLMKRQFIQKNMMKYENFFMWFFWQIICLLIYFDWVRFSLVRFPCHVLFYKCLFSYRAFNWYCDFLLVQVFFSVVSFLLEPILFSKNLKLCSQWSQDILKTSLRRLLYVVDVSKTSLRRPVMTGLGFFSLFFLFLKVYNNLYNKTEQDKINLKNNFFCLVLLWILWVWN